jgi:carbamoyltransferase
MKTKNFYILGISSGYHDSAAALIKNGQVIGAVEEERFTGIKHDSSFPTNTINWLLKENNITSDDINVVCFYEKPDLKISRIKNSTKRGGISNEINRQKIIYNNKEEYRKVEKTIKKLFPNSEIFYTEHHLSHLAYSFYTSPYERAMIVSVDGVGELETTVIAYGEENKIIKLQSVNFPHSLGMLYSVFTAFLGFKPNEGEYKVMGLAPYGDYKKYLSKFSQLISPTDDGGYEINMKYFTYDWDDSSMFNEKLGQLLGLPNRLPEDEITQDHKDLAATLQHEYEHYFFRLLNRAIALRPTNNVCLSGGCAYNGTANGKITDKTPFKGLWIPAAPSDAGSAIGAGLYYWYNEMNNKVRVNNTNPYLGPWYSNEEIKETLDNFSEQVWYEYKNHSELIPIISREITDGNVVGWFEGRMEFGSRALGNRSILANPRDPQMKARVNRVIKKREGFRPFAPIIKEEERLKYFDYKHLVPYMNQVVKVKEEHQKQLPAITHIDGSARIQTLNNRQHTRIYKLLNQLEKDNKYPIVLNTSFNLKDQTMVLDPKTAIETFLNCEMDTLVLNNYIVKKKII